MIILAVIGIALCSFASVNGIEIRLSGTYSHSYYTVSLVKHTDHFPWGGIYCLRLLSNLQPISATSKESGLAHETTIQQSCVL